MRLEAYLVMPTTVVVLLVLSGAALYFMTAEERVRLARSVVAALRHAIRAAAYSAASDEPLDEFLRERTGRAVVTPLLVAVNALVFTLMVLDGGALSDPQTSINWGGNIALRTTNGEWWRLAAAIFVHAGPLHLAATIAGLVPLGIVLERAVGRVAFASIYLAAGVAAGVVSLWTTPATSVSFGASGAVFGVYGLLLASLTWVGVSRPAGPVPWILIRRIAAASVPFVLYNLVTDYLGTTSELAGLATGFAGGLMVARGVTAEKPPMLRAAMVMAATILVAAGASFTSRGVVDVRPDIAAVAAVEQRTAGAYDAAVAKFRLGRIPAKGLVQVIDQTIIPDLQAARAHVNALRGVPPEQAPLVAAAEEYFRLREKSWRDRIDGLRKARMDVLRKAEQSERAALEAFEKIRPETRENPQAGG
jgi:membrane associated rhomboid family serine protease